jgi:hypothetical protein
MFSENPRTGRNYWKLASRRVKNESPVNGQAKTPGNNQEFLIKQQKTRSGHPQNLADFLSSLGSHILCFHSSFGRGKNTGSIFSSWDPKEFIRKIIDENFLVSSPYIPFTPPPPKAWYPSRISTFPQPEN